MGEMITPPKPDAFDRLAFDEGFRIAGDVYPAEHSPTIIMTAIIAARWARAWTLANDPTVRALATVVEKYLNQPLKISHHGKASTLDMPYEEIRMGLEATDALAAWKEKIK